MAIAEVTAQRNTQGGAASTSVTFTYPTGPVQGNLLVACWSYRLSGTTISATPSGWTNIERRNGNINTVISWKIAGASEPTTHVWTLSASVKSAGGATSYSGISSTPADKNASASGTSTAFASGTTATTAQADELWVVAAGCDTNATFSGYTNSFVVFAGTSSTGGPTNTRNTGEGSAKIVSATGTASTAATVSASVDWAGVVATFKGQSVTAVQGSFTADSYVKKTATQSFTADSNLKATISGSITSDAYVKKTTSGSLTADASIGILVQQSFTADSNLSRLGLSGSLTADSNLSLLGITGSFTADANLSLIGIQGSLTADSHLSALDISGSFTADAQIQGSGSTVEQSLTADSEISRILRPVWTTPADTVNMSSQPDLTFLIPNAVGDSHYWMELDTVSTFDGGDYVAFKTHVSQTGWEYWDGGAWQPFPATGVSQTYVGNEARYSVQSPLANNTWYRRVRGGA